MAGFFQNFVSDVAKGFFENPNLRDATHASNVFRPNAYGYSPKFKFLFHVYFDINKDAIQGTNSWPDDQNFGLAVKSVQLPKYTFDLHTLNQYNRKRNVQTKIKYDPVQITLHDDNSNLIRKLWYTYYSYYFKDPETAETGMGSSRSSENVFNPAGSSSNKTDVNRRDIYDESLDKNDWGYIGETSIPKTAIASSAGVSKAPFFRAINIYGFNQHNFVLYRLINPTIESFSHDTYDYAQPQGIMEHQLTFQYEFVKYYDGAIDGKNPSQVVTGFGEDAHYDKTLSPIARPGSQSNILGQGGLVDAAGGIMKDLESGNIVGAIQKAGVAANTYKNPQNILNIAKSEVLTGITNSLKGTPNRNTQFNFPSAADSVNNVKTAINRAYQNTTIK